VLWAFTYDELYGLEYRLVSLLCSERPFRFEKLTYSGWMEFIQGLKMGVTKMDDW